MKDLLVGKQKINKIMKASGNVYYQYPNGVISPIISTDVSVVIVAFIMMFIFIVTAVAFLL